MLKSKLPSCTCTSSFSSSTSKISSTSNLIPTTSSRYLTTTSFLSGKFDKSIINKPRHISRPRDSNSAHSFDDPRLPTVARLPSISDVVTIDTITPGLLQSLRLKLMSQSARPPTRSELELALPGFLKRERINEAKNLNAAFDKLGRMKQMEDKLAVARKWAEDMEESVGILKKEDRELKQNFRRNNQWLDWKRNGGNEESFKEFLEEEEEKVRIREMIYTNSKGRDGSKERRVASLTKEYLDSKPSSYPIPAVKPTLTTESEVQPKPSVLFDPSGKPYPEWRTQKLVLAQKFPEGWAPPKLISNEAKTLLRLLQKSNPTLYTTPILAEKFRISSEAVRRILKSQFELSEEESNRREQRRKEERAAEGGGQSWGGNVRKESMEMKELNDGAENEFRSRKSERDSARNERRGYSFSNSSNTSSRSQFSYDNTSSPSNDRYSSPSSYSPPSSPPPLTSSASASTSIPTYSTPILRIPSNQSGNFSTDNSNNRSNYSKPSQYIPSSSSHSKSRSFNNEDRYQKRDRFDRNSRGGGGDRYGGSRGGNGGGRGGEGSSSGPTQVSWTD